MKIDKISEDVLDELRKDGRQSIRRLARKINAKPSSVFYRMKMMEKEGLIKGYKAILDRKKAGYGAMAIVLISYRHSRVSQKEVAERLARFKNVVSVFIIAGQWDIALIVLGKDVEDLGDFVTGKLREMEGIDKTMSMIVLKEVKEIVF